ncbi:thioredoxin domain-containing protein [Citrobacter amalonaticus]|nr:thioredoxin domain-containing protein [Citrobacter amalonaticus]
MSSGLNKLKYVLMLWPVLSIGTIFAETGPQPVAVYSNDVTTKTATDSPAEAHKEASEIAPVIEAASAPEVKTDPVVSGEKPSSDTAAPAISEADKPVASAATKADVTAKGSSPVAAVSENTLTAPVNSPAPAVNKVKNDTGTLSFDALPDKKLAVTSEKTPVAENAPQTAAFTPAQEKRIGEIAAEYFLAHPDLLVQVGQKLTQQREEENYRMQVKAAIVHQSQLTDEGKETPVFGSETAPVSVTVFSDYQCTPCSRLSSELMYAMNGSPEARFWFREWPVMATRWPASLKAAQTGLQIWQRKGIQAYMTYRKAVFATGHTEGDLTTQDIRRAATQAGSSALVASGEALDTMSRTDELAQQIGLDTPPVIVVMPVTGATPENTTVITGMTTAENIRAAIVLANGQAARPSHNAMQK